MHSTPFVRRVLRDDAVTRGLGDIEARILVEWLAQRIETAVERSEDEASAQAEYQMISRRGRLIARFVSLWAEPQSRGSAAQLAASERGFWPLPCGDIESWALMESLIDWCDQQAAISRNRSPQPSSNPPVTSFP